MSEHLPRRGRDTEQEVREDLQQPHLCLRLVENALTVAESLRSNYFHNTARFIMALRKALSHTRPIMTCWSVGEIDWDAVQGERVTFLDAGIGQVQISSRVPILLRVGTYQVRTGERRLAEREQFGYYPVILGDLEGGSKERVDFPSIVRITAELLGGLSALEGTPDLRVLMFHGPLVYPMAGFVGHTPFTEGDIDLFLRQYSSSAAVGRDMKEEFLDQARVEIYPRMTDRSDEWAERRLFEPLAWNAYLYRRLLHVAAARSTPPIIAGVVERGASRDFSERVLLERVFRRLRDRGNAAYFNQLYGRSDLTSPQAVLDRLGYTDTFLLATLLQPGECSEPWEMEKLAHLDKGDVSLPGEAGRGVVNFAPLRHRERGFPAVRATYVRVSEPTDPIRVEVFQEMGEEQLRAAAQRVYLYSRLLPGYGFPVGLDVADKYAHVPAWLTEAYSKLIRYHLAVSLQQGEISDAEIRRLLVQAIYMTHRDWLFRPHV
jgi:hypothetical protein